MLDMRCTCSNTHRFLGGLNCAGVSMDGWISDTLTVSGVNLHPWDLPQHNAHVGTHVWASSFCSNTPLAPWVGLIWGRLLGLCKCVCKAATLRRIMVLPKVLEQFFGADVFQGEDQSQYLRPKPETTFHKWTLSWFLFRSVVCSCPHSCPSPFPWNFITNTGNTKIKVLKYGKILPNSKLQSGACE